MLEQNIFSRWWWTGKRVANTYSGEDFYTSIWLLCSLLYNVQIDYQGNVTLLTQSMYMSKCKVLDESSKDCTSFIFQRVRSLRHICLCTSVNCVVQSLVQCRMSLAAHFSRSMWPTTRLTHKDASSPLPLGLMQFLGWVESGWENQRKSFFELFLFIYIRSTWRLETKWIKKKCAMDIPHLVTSILDNIRIHHTQNELSKLDISCPGIFKLEDFWAERSERNDACCEEPFADITYVKNTNPLYRS